MNTPEIVVAVIEDDEGMRRALRRILETEGYMAELHATAEDFLAQRARSAARCMVLDLRLPGMSGIDLMGVLRSEGRSLPTVLVTGFDMHFAWAERAGATCCLLKPFAPKALLDAVQLCVNEGSA